jgi:spore coat protein U-like protein
MTKRIAIHASAALALLLGMIAIPGTSTAAGSRTGTVDVSTSVAASCNISAATLTFPAYDPVFAHATTPDDATGTITVRCTSGATGITIDLGPGAHNPGNTQRQMVHGANSSILLSYEVYKDTNRTFVWGQGDGGTVRSGTDLDGTGASVEVTMFGRIAQGQVQAISGSYTDTLVSTINF